MAIQDVPLDTFLKREGSLSEEDFLDRFSRPFLVVEKRKVPRKDTAVYQTLSPDEKEDDDTVAEPRVARGTDDAGELFVFELDKSGRNAFENMLTLGRAANNDVVVDDHAVSKLHGFFRHNPLRDLHTFTDVGSTNGTTHEGVPLERNRPVEMQSGQTLLLGGAVKAQFFETKAFHEYLAVYRRLRKSTTSLPAQE